MLGFQALGPVRDHRGGDAAFVLVLFVESEGGVAGVGPAGVVGPIGFFVPRFQVAAPGAFEGAGAVVRAEEEEGVLPDSFLFQFADETADVLVEHVDHRGEDFHAIGFPLFLAVLDVGEGGDVSWTGGVLPLLGDHAGAELFAIALGADLVPTGVVLAVVFLDVLLGGLERVVRGVVGKVEEERLLAVDGFIEEFKRVVRDGVGRVEAAAVEYRQKKLRINSIIPSINDTDMLRKGVEERGNDFDEFVGLYKELTPLGRISKPEDIAGMVCLLLHPEFFETGQHIHCSGGNSLLGQPRLLVTQDLS